MEDIENLQRMMIFLDIFIEKKFQVSWKKNIKTTFGNIEIFYISNAKLWTNINNHPHYDHFYLFY